MLGALLIAHKIYSLFNWCRQPLTAEILGYIHKWVNLDVTYVDAETGVHTNRIESRLVCNFIVSLSLKYVLSINNEICTVSPHFPEQVNFSFLLIFLVCSLLLRFYMLSFWETFPFPQLPCRPSKCPKFYTNRILGEQNLRQKVRKFGQNLNRDKLTYLIQYTLTVQFII